MGFDLGDAAKGVLGGGIFSDQFKGLFGGGTPENMTITNKTELPKWLMPYFQGALGDAQNLYNTSGPSQATQTGIDELLGFNPAGAQSALDLNQRTLAGDFLSPSSNPWLQQAFDSGADALQGRLGSQFAAAGRNVGPSAGGAFQGATAQGLSSLAGDIFGGNYQQERGRQMQAMGMAPALDAGIMSGINAQLMGGDMLDQQGWDRLNNYTNTISQLASPFSVNTSTQPLYRNKLAGLAGGAMAGAQIGGPWGAVIGGGLGLLGGG